MARLNTVSYCLFAASHLYGIQKCSVTRLSHSIPLYHSITMYSHAGLPTVRSHSSLCQPQGSPTQVALR